MFTHVLKPVLTFASHFFARPLLILMTLFSFVFSAQSLAHSLKVFADFEGQKKVSGSVYFSRGVPARNAKVEIFSLSKTDEKTLLLSSRTDQDGRFSFDNISAAKVMISANSGDGHVGRYTFNAKVHSHDHKEHNHSHDHDHDHDQKSHSHSHPSDGDKTDEPVAKTTEEKVEQASIDMTAIKVMVEDAVAAQVLPLREELHKAQHDARFSDIVGGIGFIFGIAGLVMWWRARKEPVHQNQTNEGSNV